MSMKNVTLLSVVLLCATWMVAQAASGSGAAPGRSGQSATPGSTAPPTGAVNPANRNSAGHDESGNHESEYQQSWDDEFQRN